VYALFRRRYIPEITAQGSGPMLPPDMRKRAWAVGLAVVAVPLALLASARARRGTDEATARASAPR
jgi:hypothetical protein